MGIFGTIYNSTAGLKTSSMGLQIAGNNIANLHSTGYRGSIISFADLLAYGSGEALTPVRNGGSTVKTVEIDFSGAGFTTTDIPTDLAIQGPGFFIVSDGEEFFYTRDGQFHLEETPEGRLRLVNPLGMNVMGTDPEQTAEGTLTLQEVTLQPIEFARLTPGQATGNIQLEINLDARKKTEEISRSLLDSWNAGETPPINPQDYEFVYTLKIYDTLGTERLLNLYFDTTDQPGRYEFMIASADPAEDARGTGPYQGVYLWGTLDFGASGEIETADLYRIQPDGTQETVAFSEEGYPTFEVNFTGESQTITLDLGFYFQDGVLQRSSTGVHMYAAPFAVYNYTQDGYTAGVFETLEIDAEGMVRVRYDNGLTREAGRIWLADFSGREDSLERAGLNLFRPQAQEVVPYVFTPGIGQGTSLVSGALENSNVDLATEMTNLILLQRVFQSNARVITTADQLMEDIMRAR